ncbi:Immunoglobulin lambda variable 5-45 [Channa argus]|nr:Immunoglobulin lambda variable 5-45 [Channa argus]
MFVTALYLTVLTHSGLSVVVLQSGDQVSPPGVPVTMNCSMGPGFTMSSYNMLWYRQKHYGAAVEFLLTEFDQTVGHFKASLDAAKNKFSLLITELFVNDSSTYYCAASHSAAHTSDSHTNNKSLPRRWRQEGAVAHWVVCRKKIISKVEVE